MNQLMQSGMVVILEKGLTSSMEFMQAIHDKGLEGNLKGWWWSSDKGLIQDPSESDEMVVKAQTMYDAMMGKPVNVSGVKMFQTRSPSEMRKMIDVCKYDVMAYSESAQLERPKLPPRDTPPLPLRSTSDSYDPRLDPNLGK